MRRSIHGLIWGAAATLVMGTATLLLLALGLYPGGRPVSVLVAQRLLVTPVRR